MRFIAVIAPASFLFIVGLLASCGFHVGENSLAVSGKNPLAYIKLHPQRLTGQNELLSYRTSASLEACGPAGQPNKLPCGDLYLRDIAQPDSAETNITGTLTKGYGAVADPEASYDGRKIAFSLRCSKFSSIECASDTTWNIWEYDLVDKTLQRVIRDPHIANVAHDFAPAYLSDGRIVFSSTRQQATRDNIGYFYLDSDWQFEAMNLHVMDGDGGRIQQISFHNGHDLNPSVQRNGRILFSRWEKVDEKNQVSIYEINPDGSGLAIVYGAHSPGEMFLYPHSLEDGRLISSVLPMANTWHGGAAMIINAAQYTDFDQAAAGVPNNKSGQVPATVNSVPIEQVPSQFGRYAYPYPVLDGSNQILVSYSPFKATGKVIPDPQKATLGDIEAPPTYGIYMLGASDKSLRPIILPTANEALIQPIAVIARTAPSYVAPKRNPQGGELGMGILNILSVYDNDRFQYMGPAVLTNSELARAPLPTRKPANPASDIREIVTDIAVLKNPGLTKAENRPARFVRITKAVLIPKGLQLQAIGVNNLTVQQIIGYAPVEPDGSVRVRVPADVPLAITVLDEFGRAFQTHQNWFQVRAGEELVCNGCHSPIKQQPLNSGAITQNHINTVWENEFYTPGQTMAQTHTLKDVNALNLTMDLHFVDVWTKPGLMLPDQTPRNIDPEIFISLNQLNTARPSDGFIDYAAHIQPIWNNRRNGQACVDCHNGVISQAHNPSGLSLEGAVGGANGHAYSFDELTIGKPVFDTGSGIVIDVVDGKQTVRTVTPLVVPGHARESYLIEKIYNQELFAERGLPQNGLDHSVMLNLAEKRLISDWIDIGAKYVSKLVKDDGSLVAIPEILDFFEFSGPAYGAIKTKCASCHQPLGVSGQNPDYKPSRYNLTLDTKQDFFSTSFMVTDIQNPANSALLTKPTATSTHIVNGSYVLTVGDAYYDAILGWLIHSRDKINNGTP